MVLSSQSEMCLGGSASPAALLQLSPPCSGAVCGIAWGKCGGIFAVETGVEVPWLG